MRNHVGYFFVMTRGQMHTYAVHALALLLAQRYIRSPIRWLKPRLADLSTGGRKGSDREASPRRPCIHAIILKRPTREVERRKYARHIQRADLHLAGPSFFFGEAENSIEDELLVF